MSKLGTRRKSSSSSGGASGHPSVSTSSSPDTSGTSFPVPGSGRIAIVPPVETTTTSALIRPLRGRRGGGCDVDRALEPELLVDTFDTPSPQPQSDRDDDEHREDQRQCDERRRRAERIEIRSDRGRLD